MTTVTTDPEALEMTLVADFAAPPDRVWGAFADPRKLERFWGPPGYPATFGSFDFRVGGVAQYWMTSPEGERYPARWEFVAIDEPRTIEVIDAFANADGDVDTGQPLIATTFEFAETTSGTRLHVSSRFASQEALEQAMAIGMLEGTELAISQLDAVLADLREYALGKGTQTEVLDDTHVRITRAFDAPRALIWRAHTEPELMKRWLLGPDGWRMTECEFDPVAGGAYRYAWEPVDGTPGEGFGFDGETVVFEPERRMVSTERMTGTDYPPTLNDLSFAEDDGVTLLTLIVTYADAAQRDAVLATGMTEGMEASYARLERELVTTG